MLRHHTAYLGMYVFMYPYQLHACASSPVESLLEYRRVSALSFRLGP